MKIQIIQEVFSCAQPNRKWSIMYLPVTSTVGFVRFELGQWILGTIVGAEQRFTSPEFLSVLFQLCEKVTLIRLLE